jgi:peptidyl-prolyl cis-trans isomerase C
MRHTLCLTLLVALAAAPSALAQSLAPAAPAPQPGPPGAANDPILVQNALVTIRKSDYELELERLPPDIRPGFANSERRVNDLLRRMLVERTLAAQAREEGLDRLPGNARRLEAEIDRLLTIIKVQKIEADAAAEFEANRSAWETRARELYTIDRAKYATPEQFFASHILFETKTKSREDALKLAREAHAQVVAGADFNELARKVSEDPSAKRNFGKIDWFTAGDMDPAFSAAVAKLKPGQVSEPVLSSFGWHVIKLEGHRPAAQKTFDDVRNEIIGELRQKFVNDRREAALARVRSDPSIRANREAIEALVVRVDPEAVRRALQHVPMPSTLK